MGRAISSKKARRAADALYDRNPKTWEVRLRHFAAHVPPRGDIESKVDHRQMGAALQAFVDWTAESDLPLDEVDTVIAELFCAQGTNRPHMRGCSIHRWVRPLTPWLSWPEFTPHELLRRLDANRQTRAAFPLLGLALRSEWLEPEKRYFFVVGSDHREWAIDRDEPGPLWEFDSRGGQPFVGPASLAALLRQRLEALEGNSGGLYADQCALLRECLSKE